MDFKPRTINQIANMICGNFAVESTYFIYRSSKYLTEFFGDCDTDYVHDGSTRDAWVAGVLKDILNQPHPSPLVPPQAFLTVIDRLMDRSEAINEGSERQNALENLNISLSREGFEAFYGDDGKCHLRHIATNTLAAQHPSPHRPLTNVETERRHRLASFLDIASEDELIERVLIPLLRQLGFHRVTAAGHRDKILEYGKDIWMKYTLPTTHVLYFGLQAKKGKLDTSGVTKAGNANMAEIHNQTQMMLGHEIFDPEIGKRVLVDHAYIVAGGEITKQARNWLGNKLDASKRSQIMFMDREDILNLYIVTNLPLPDATEAPTPADEDEIPF